MNPTLWETLGGEEVMAKVVSDFVDAVVADPRVNYTRGGRYPLDAEILANTKRTSLEFVSQAMVRGDRFQNTSKQGSWLQRSMIRYGDVVSATDGLS